MSKKLPTAVHEATGTARADRQHDDEPRPDVGVPPMPEDFDEAEQKAWERCVEILKPLGVLTVADGFSLEQLVVSIIECADLKKVVRASPTQAVTTTQKETVDRMHPLYPAWNQARDRLIRLWSVFGLDPLARTSLHTVRAAPRRQGTSSDGQTKQSARDKRKADYFTRH